MINLILFGPPGSGKGTQAEKLIKKYKLVHLSTGDLFRYNLKNNTPLGLEAKKFIDKGELVPDSVTINMLKDKMETSPKGKGYIFDGYPRTIPQAHALDELLGKQGQTVSALIMLDVDDEEIVKRILERGKVSGRADDTDEKIIRNRMELYKKETTPVFDFYAASDKSMKINGIGTILAIFRRTCKAINNLKK